MLVQDIVDQLHRLVVSENRCISSFWLSITHAIDIQTSRQVLSSFVAAEGERVVPFLSVSSLNGVSVLSEKKYLHQKIEGYPEVFGVVSAHFLGECDNENEALRKFELEERMKMREMNVDEDKFRSMCVFSLPTLYRSRPKIKFGKRNEVKPQEDEIEGKMSSKPIEKEKTSRQISSGSIKAKPKTASVNAFFHRVDHETAMKSMASEAKKSAKESHRARARASLDDEEEDEEMRGGSAKRKQRKTSNDGIERKSPLKEEKTSTKVSRGRNKQRCVEDVMSMSVESHHAKEMKADDDDDAEDDDEGDEVIDKFVSKFEREEAESRKREEEKERETKRMEALRANETTKRRILKTKTFVNEKGYLVTEDVWEEVSVEPATSSQQHSSQHKPFETKGKKQGGKLVLSHPPQKMDKRKPSKASSKTPAKSSSKPKKPPAKGQQSITSFFG